MGYSNPTPIQEQAIPLVLEGRDVIAAAKTGTGKTAAFSLPCMDKLPHRERGQRGPFMLVITPTRELASQISDTCMPIGKHTRHFIGTFVGGVSYDPQIRKLERGLDVAIATPGRLIDLMERGAIDLDSVEVLVLDEADRMLDMGFWPQVERIVNATPETRQTLLFSATIDRSQDQTMFSILNDPAIVEIAQRGETADKVDQYVIQTTRRLKPELLNSFIKEKGGTRVIVFTKTKGCADNCTRRLRRVGIPTDAIHADRSQAQRSRALDSFRKGTTNVIVATDVLARGIDVPEVDYVVNYDLPLMPEDYVHRIGRTGRAGAGGFAVSFVTPDTKNLLKSIQKFIGQTIDVMEYKISDDAFEPLDNADPRVVAQGKAELEERAARKERERGRKGASMGEGKKGGKKKTRQRDKDRSAEFKRRKEAEAAGEEYIAPKRDHAEKGPRKPTLAERQAAAEEAFNAMFDMPNIPGEGSKKSKAKGKGKGGNGYSYAAFEKGKKHKGSHDGYERDYDEEPRNRKGKRSFDRDGDFGNRNDRFFDEDRNDRKPRGKKYSDKQYSDGRGSKPGKKYNKSGKRGASFEGRGSSDGYQRSGKGRGSSDGFQRSGKGGHGKQSGSFSKGGKGSFDKGRKGNGGGRGKSEFRPGRGGRSEYAGKGGKR
ncbi:DEAD/DEAH box helicase [Slackia piriformis]|uniref:DEAD/DEAH box helicase n=1 Tax=Slackia piriformis TaxID=626934 RepID=UPI0032C1917A